ncbi:HAD-IA family hydrolase [Pokkaliibacter sp. MBI-7]|uniref:HAD family hydrolase n=1 Tax=Pokkaliibacter sp. MBI-7 TaxID=3040600 RepID=UPI002449CEB6|nr:HAD-IA family hydrolase [Pokkaliibacter sp. MBI-7]MDH2435188.1 HAD-IA family hydrolase [Pokkaliibacter sp. MBI-7]
MYKLIIFDWDGTLIDSAQRITQCMLRAAKDAGLAQPSASQIRELIGLGLPEMVEALFPGISPQSNQYFRTIYSHHFFDADQQPSPTFPHVRETLTALREASYSLAVATGKSRRGLDRGMQNTGLGEYFSASRCADETASKPHPQMLFELLEHYGVQASDALLVGDTSFDLQMAQAAGIDSTAVLYGVHGAERLEPFAPKAFFTSIRDIVHWLTETKEKG